MKRLLPVICVVLAAFAAAASCEFWLASLPPSLPTLESRRLKPSAAQRSAASSSGLRPAATAGPRLLIAECNTHNMGKGAVGDTLSGTLEFGNSGSQELTFRFELGCGCASVNPSSGALPPGTKTKVDITLRLREEGRDEYVSMRLVTNDPTSPVHQRYLYAKCPTWLSAEPSAVNFGNFRDGETREQVVTLLDKDRQPSPASASVAVSTSTELLQAGWASDSPTEHRLRLKLGPLLKGDFSGHVLLTGKDPNGKERELRVPVAARGVGLFTVAPTSLSLPRRNSSEKSVPFKIVVRVQKPELADEVVVASNPQGLSIEKEPSAHPRLRCFQVRANGISAIGNSDEEIVFALRDQLNEQERVQVHWRD